MKEMITDVDQILGILHVETEGVVASTTGVAADLPIAGEEIANTVVGGLLPTNALIMVIPLVLLMALLTLP